MGPSEHDLEHPKKRRRREVERRPLAARLLFDESVKGGAAIVSQSLWAQLALPTGNSSAHSPNFRSGPLLTLHCVHR